MESWRFKRQFFIIGIIFAAILAVIVWFSWRFIPISTCFDNKKNQKETGVDCGASCIPCELKNPKDVVLYWARVVPVRQNIYDVAAELRNPNEIISVSLAEYEFLLFDQFGAVAQRKGTTFLFPQERTHIIEASIATTRSPERVEFRIVKADWKLEQIQEPNIAVERKEYSIKEENGVKRSVVTASLVNRTPFDYREIMVNFIVADASGNVLGVNKVSVDNFEAGLRRNVISLWPQELKGVAATIDVEPRVNLFESGAVIKPQ